MKVKNFIGVVLNKEVFYFVDSFHLLPKRLYCNILTCFCKIKYNRDFLRIIDGCAVLLPDREQIIWINPLIRSLYKALFDQDHAYIL